MRHIVATVLSLSFLTLGVLPVQAENRSIFDQVIGHSLGERVLGIKSCMVDYQGEDDFIEKSEYSDSHDFICAFCIDDVCESIVSLKSSPLLSSSTLIVLNIPTGQSIEWAEEVVGVLLDQESKKVRAVITVVNDSGLLNIEKQLKEDFGTPYASKIWVNSQALIEEDKAKERLIHWQLNEEEHLTLYYALSESFQWETPIVIYSNSALSENEAASLFDTFFNAYRFSVLGM